MHRVKQTEEILLALFCEMCSYLKEHNLDNNKRGNTILSLL